ncbi:MAG: SRPBCC domain-containing protein [Anaerolineaceae bacterium]|nr:SRPBCC domain-containing protein [Anaerolineaceae bacterium]
MSESLRIQIDLPVSPERVYRAWFDSYEHSQFTGSEAKIEAKVGGKYTAWDGYIEGETRVMTPFSRIVQTWRTSEFPPGSPDSLVEIKLEPTCLGALLTLDQSGIPDGQAKQYLEGWEEYYFRPLKAYFEKLLGENILDIDG